MIVKGGKRVGAGRKPGSVTRKTREIAEKTLASGLSPLEYLLSIMRNDSLEQNVRVDAAKSAAPYIHPRLSNVEADVNVTGHEAALSELE